MKGPKPRPVAERFWAKVLVTDDDSCWEWQAARYRNGYGAFAPAAGHTNCAHRIAWVLIHGPIVDRDTFVLHKCDNRRCVNPRHLFLGAAADNTADMVSKGRSGWQRGQHRWRKVDEGFAHAILVMLAQGVSQEATASHYGIGHSTVGSIKNGKTSAARFALGV